MEETSNKAAVHAAVCVFVHKCTYTPINSADCSTGPTRYIQEVSKQGAMVNRLLLPIATGI